MSSKIQWALTGAIGAIQNGISADWSHKSIGAIKHYIGTTTWTYRVSLKFRLVPTEVIYGNTKNWIGANWTYWSHQKIILRPLESNRCHPRLIIGTKKTNLVPLKINLTPTEPVGCDPKWNQCNRKTLISYLVKSKCIKNFYFSAVSTFFYVFIVWSF